MNKTALITGASSGIGLALAEQMIANDYEVIGVARDFSAVAQPGLNMQSLDLSNVDYLPKQLSANDAFNDAVDVLVLNAGYGQFGGIEQFSHQQIRAMVDTNLVSNLFLIKHFLPKMKANGSGDIVIVGSESALQGGKNGAVYCATKFALRGLAQSLRQDCSTSNIRVILVNPGPVSSDFFDTLNFEPQDGVEFVIEPDQIASVIVNALLQPANVVCDEINVQPLKRSFKKK